MKDFNEKCAEYLGWKCVPDNIDSTDTVSWLDSEDKKYEWLRFDRDWNWIIIVITKIMEECFDGDTNEAFEDYYCILDAIPDLEDTKQAIYNYITNDKII